MSKTMQVQLLTVISIFCFLFAVLFKSLVLIILGVILIFAGLVVDTTLPPRNKTQNPVL